MELDRVNEGMVGFVGSEAVVKDWKDVMDSPKSLIVLLRERSNCKGCWRSYWDMGLS
jgi:hypothetical protein